MKAASFSEMTGAHLADRTVRHLEGRDQNFQIFYLPIIQPPVCLRGTLLWVMNLAGS
jgi:hypothetical protein